MNDEPREETRMESQRADGEHGNSLERETRAASQVDTVSASNGNTSREQRSDGDAPDDAKIEVVLLSNDEAEGDLPRTLTDTGPSLFRWYVLAPGVVATAAAAVLLLKYRQLQQSTGLRAALDRAAATASPFQGLSDAGKGLSAIAVEQKARAQALAAQAKARAGKAAPPPKKSAWEETRDSAQAVVSENLATIAALVASTGLTIAARLVDVKREGSLPLPQPAPKKAWYRIGPWS